MVFDALQKANFEPWLDRDALSGGELWNARIQDELDATDFALVLYTPALCRKTDSYVNKEITLARERARSVRGPPDPSAHGRDRRRGPHCRAGRVSGDAGAPRRLRRGHDQGDLVDAPRLSAPASLGVMADQRIVSAPSRSRTTTSRAKSSSGEAAHRAPSPTRFWLTAW